MRPERADTSGIGTSRLAKPRLELGQIVHSDLREGASERSELALLASQACGDNWRGGCADRDCGPPVPVLGHIAGAAAGPAGHAARASMDTRRAHLPSTSRSALGMLRLSSMALSGQEMASSNWPLASITPPRQLSPAVFSAFTSSCSYPS